MTPAAQLLSKLRPTHHRMVWASDDNIRVIPAHVVKRIKNRLHRRMMFTEDVDRFSPRQLAAIRGYTGAGSYYLQINGQLRDKGYEDLLTENPISWLQHDRGKMRTEIDDLDSVINNSKLDRDMTLYRGIPFDVANHQIYSLHPGDHIHDAGYMSTTRNKKLAEHYSRNGTAMMVVHAKAGDTAFDVPPEIHGATWSGTVEDEIVFPRDTVLEFTGKTNGYYNFEVVD